MKKKQTKDIQKESCWNTIGVWGSGAERCPKLAELTHCRNCGVFAEAGGDLLDREPPEGYVDEWSRLIAPPKQDADAGTLSIIVFKLGGESFAFRTEIFKEIICTAPIHRIPHRSDDVLLGLVNVHGELQLCFSLKALMGGEAGSPANPSQTDSKMLVIEKDGESWVFPVDQALGVFRCELSKDPNVPVTIAKASGTFTRKVVTVDGKEVGLLDDELLIYSLQRRLA